MRKSFTLPMTLPVALASLDALELETEAMQQALRLRSTRLAAGYVFAKDAAQDLAIPATTYRNTENGVHGISKAIVHAAERTFGASADYILAGNPQTEVDTLAERILVLLGQAEQESRPPVTDAGEFALRLREMRLHAGFRTAAESARSKGWVVSTYSSHEAGLNPVSPERLIGYALSFGVRPEYAVMGEMPMVSEGDVVNWQDRRAMGTLKPEDLGDAWKWLRYPGGGDLPVLHMTDGRFQVAGKRLTIPLELLGAEKRPWPEGGCYAVIDPRDAGLCHVIDPTGKTGKMVLAHEDGRIVLDAKRVIGAAATDPTRKRSFQEGLLLGTLLATIAIRLHAG